QGPECVRGDDDGTARVTAGLIGAQQTGGLGEHREENAYDAAHAHDDDQRGPEPLRQTPQGHGGESETLPQERHGQGPASASATLRRFSRSTGSAALTSARTAADPRAHANTRNDTVGLGTLRRSAGR